LEAWNLQWWHWLMSGVALLALELVTPGALFLMFFGVAAIVVGLLTAVGLAGPLWAQVALFALLSLLSLVTLRGVFLKKLQPTRLDRNVDRLVGETALALDDLPIDGIGKAELRGSAWNARNVGDSVVSRGQRCVVIRIDGLTLWVARE
jgi:membrane protein implicated in regulation of membrane protease activity